MPKKFLLERSEICYKNQEISVEKKEKSPYFWIFISILRVYSFINEIVFYNVKKKSLQWQFVSFIYFSQED